MSKSHKQLSITLIKGVSGCTERQKKCVRTLGLHRVGETIDRPDEPSVRGLIKSVDFLVDVKER